MIEITLTDVDIRLCKKKKNYPSNRWNLPTIDKIKVKRIEKRRDWTPACKRWTSSSKERRKLRKLGGLRKSRGSHRDHSGSEEEDSCSRREEQPGEQLSSSFRGKVAVKSRIKACICAASDVRELENPFSRKYTQNIHILQWMNHRLVLLFSILRDTQRERKVNSSKHLISMCILSFA